MAMITYPYIRLDRIPTDPVVMKLLPEEVAYRYHALPVAINDDQITVVMASPGDSEAINAVQSVIDAPICLLEADPKEIDQRINDLWLKKSESELNLIDWSVTSDVDQAHQIYVESFARLLSSNLVSGESARWSYTSFSDLTEFSRESNSELHIFPKNNLKPLYQIRRYSSLLNGRGKFPNALIIPCQPKWRLKKILLILPDWSCISDCAIYWTLLLGELSGAQIMVLPIGSPKHSFSSDYSNKYSDNLLEDKGILGRSMRMISEKLTDRNIRSSFKFQPGEPVDQVHGELQSSKPDFIILARSPEKLSVGHMVNELMSYVVNRYQCPLLMSRE